MMIRLYLEQLRAQLTEGLRAAYLLLGNDPLLLQESRTPFAKLLPRRALPSTILFNRQQHRLAGDFRLKPR